MTRRTNKVSAAQADDEVAWDDDSDDETSGKPATETNPRASVTSVDTLHVTEKNPIKKTESRKSDETSQADSEASYDVVGAASGKTSQAPSSPKDPKKDEDSDEDWE